MASGFRWVTPPEAELMPNIEAYGEKVMIAVRAVADYMAQKIQAEMRSGARWEDRTGNARGGLFSVVEQASEDLVTIWLSHGHTVHYGVFLELAHGKKFAIIAPTIQRNLPVIEGMLKQIFE
jgi:hypothetical protein